MMILCVASATLHAQKISVDRATLVALTKQAEQGQLCCQAYKQSAIQVQVQADSTASYQAKASRLASTLALTQAKLNRWRIIAIALAGIVAIRLFLYVRKILPI